MKRSLITRREFFAMAGMSAPAIAAARAIPRSQMPERDFELLVVGDSMIWGQGLNEEDKFYTLTRNWLEEDHFQGQRRVKLTVKAHSGSTIKFRPKDAAAYSKAGRSELFPYTPEINVAFPSIWKQVDVAAGEMRAEGRTADLIMLSAGITDITVAGLLDPFGDNSKLPPLIQKYCLDGMVELLQHISNTFPEAQIAVIGYYPIISPRTRRSSLFNGWLESMSFPRRLKPAANNTLTRPLLGWVRKKGISRSRIWVRESNRCLQAAVDKINEGQNARRAVFVRSPITEDTCMETPNTLLFRIAGKGRVNDPLYQHRVEECGKALKELKTSTGLEYSIRYCEIAAVGHPNAAGSRAYAESINKALKWWLRP